MTIPPGASAPANVTILHVAKGKQKIAFICVLYQKQSTSPQHASALSHSLRIQPVWRRTSTSHMRTRPCTRHVVGYRERVQYGMGQYRRGRATLAIADGAARSVCACLICLKRGGGCGALARLGHDSCARPLGDTRRQRTWFILPPTHQLLFSSRQGRALRGPPPQDLGLEEAERQLR